MGKTELEESSQRRPHQITKMSTETLFEKALKDEFSLTKIIRLAVSLSAISMALFHIITSYIGPLPSWQHRMLHVGVVLILIFCYFPYKKGAKWHKIFDGIPLVLSMGITYYAVSTYPAVVMRTGSLLPEDYFVGLLLTALILEGTRRVLGWPMVIIASFFLAYVYFGRFLSGMLGHPGFSIDMLIETLYVSTSGIFGAPIYVSSTVLVLFVIFGSFLIRSGVGSVFIDFAYAITGAIKGGPGVTAVVSSALIGSITGNGIANVAITGTFTIPLMERVGYNRNFAGACEAVASQGGQIMPPIMGASAFIIAEYLGIRYIEVVMHAIIPAALYFIIAGIMIYIEASKLNLVGLPKSQLPDWKEVLFQYGHLFLPLIIVISSLFIGYSPMRAGFLGIISVLVLSAIRQATRMNVVDILAALEDGMKNTLTVAIACASCGLIVGAITLTGVGLRFGRFAIGLAGGELVFVLIFVMLACIVLGMGMTTVSAYILAAVLGAPALIRLGVPDIAAHLFVFYFAILSGLTPPVALTSYAAAAVARGEPQKTSYYGLKLALGGFLIPYMIIINPALLLLGTSIEIIIAVTTALVGAYALASGVQGYQFTSVKLPIRALLVIAGLLLIGFIDYRLLFGLAILIIVTIMQYKKSKTHNAEQIA